MLALAIFGLFVGKVQVTLSGLLAGDEFQTKVFWTLRVSRVLVGLFGGAALGCCGYVFQTVFKNPLASPDVIGVSSGASAGAAFGILFLGQAVLIPVAAFVGALLAVLAALLLSTVDRTGKKNTIVLAGIAVHALFQTILMCLKLMADPERELASIEYWLMGSLNGISIHGIWPGVIIMAMGTLLLCLLSRQVMMLAADESEAYMLGVSVRKIRLMVLLLATLTVAGVVSLTGLISFAALMAPHIARLWMGINGRKTMIMSAVVGGSLLLVADILARSVGQTELPVSVFTSLLGAPFMLFLVAGRRQKA